MNTGDLRHRITIQSLVTTVNSNGFETETWTDYKTLWSAVTNLHGREYFTAKQVHSENTVKFTIRFTKDIDAKMRILFQGKTYNITFVDNIKYGNKFMEVQALEVI